jgi:hypothetical protein
MAAVFFLTSTQAEISLVAHLQGWWGERPAKLSHD